MKLCFPFLAVAACSLCRVFADTAPADSATTFINTREDKWMRYKHPDIQEAYPFGRSNKAHNEALDKLYDFSKISKNTDLRNKHFLAEGDWYAVEWFYSATDVATGNKQVESSLCLAQVKDQQLIAWIEYFDDTVGEQQIAGKLPLYAETEEPFPWPAKAAIKRPYRP